MNGNFFTEQLQAFQQRVTQLYQSMHTSEQLSTDLLLPSLLKELGTSSEELQVAVEEILQQHEQVATLQQQIESERQRYQELFEVMPEAYLVSDPQGKILEANFCAATLLGVEHSKLQGKLLVSFIPVEQRSAFRCKLNQLQQQNWIQKYTLSLQARKPENCDVAVTVTPICDSSGKVVTLRWILREITTNEQDQVAFSRPNYEPSNNRPKHVYFKGDRIPLEHEQLWLVCQGLVKLSTFNERGEEVLVGFVGASMPFGSSLTEQTTYQAIALSESVELVSISLAEIAACPRLAQALLPQISQRLQQTESLLAISGRRHVKERLYHLLLFLTQKFGQKVVQGTRLRIRLTHQDLADACCTTRVTITRLLGQLQQQGKITFDSKNRIIVTDDWLEQSLKAG